MAELFVGVWEFTRYGEWVCARLRNDVEGVEAESEGWSVNCLNKLQAMFPGIDVCPMREPHMQSRPVGILELPRSASCCNSDVTTPSLPMASVLY